MKRGEQIALLAAMIVLSTSPARTQSLDAAVFPIDMVTPVLRDMTLQNVLETPRRSGGARAGRLSATGQGGAAARLTSAPAKSTAYRASPAVSAQVKRRYLDFISKTVGSQAGAQYKAVLDRNDPVRNWSQLVASDGLRPGDAADALAAYWVLNWIIANRGDNNRAQTVAVRDQVRGVMASNPGFARLNEAQRQELAEVLMLNFLTQHAAFADAMQRRDQVAIRRLGDAATTRFRNEMGVDLRQLQLTNSGFVRRG